MNSSYEISGQSRRYVSFLRLSFILFFDEAPYPTLISDSKEDNYFDIDGK